MVKKVSLHSRLMPNKEQNHRSYRRFQRAAFNIYQPNLTALVVISFMWVEAYANTNQGICYHAAVGLAVDIFRASGRLI